MARPQNGRDCGWAMNQSYCIVGCKGTALGRRNVFGVFCSFDCSGAKGGDWFSIWKIRIGLRNSGQSSEPIISSLQWDVLMKGGRSCYSITGFHVGVTRKVARVWHTPEHRMIGSYPNPARKYWRRLTITASTGGRQTGHTIQEHEMMTAFHQPSEE